MKSAAHIKAVAIDSYGALIGASVYLNQDKTETVKRSHVDGQGISYLRAAGIRVALFNDGAGHMKYLQEKFNGLPSCVSGEWSPVELLEGSKKEVLGEWLSREGIAWEECAAIADDIGDLSYLREVGFSVAPLTAEELVCESVDFVTKRGEGAGAVRDFANVILMAKGVDLEILPKK